MDTKERFLPIGTVVLLKGGKRELMITCYSVIPNGKIYDKDGEIDNSTKQVFEYGGCFYPEGMISSDRILVFNHDQIEKICYIGYETEQHKALSDILNKNYENMKKGAEIMTQKLAEKENKTEEKESQA